MKHLSLLWLAACSLLLAGLTAHAADAELNVGVQTWTLRNMSFDQVVEFALKHHIKNLEMIGKHISPTAPVEENKRKKEILDQNGLVCYTFGVNGTSMNKEDNRKLFEFAKLMGIKMIVVEPKDLNQWDNLEELVKEYDIKLAIHNHGKGTPYGDPETVKKVLKARDPRIGACLDVGWVTAAGYDAAQIFKDYNGRVFDIHLKDKKIEKSVDGKDIVLDVAIGTGIANYKGLFAELKKAHWGGVLAIETDNPNFAKDPAEYVDGASKFVKDNQ